MEGGESAGLLAERGASQLKTYRRRWFLLAVVCLLNCSNAMVSGAGQHEPLGSGGGLSDPRVGEEGSARVIPGGIEEALL